MSQQLLWDQKKKKEVKDLRPALRDLPGLWDTDQGPDSHAPRPSPPPLSPTRPVS